MLLYIPIIFVYVHELRPNLSYAILQPTLFDVSFVNVYLFDKNLKSKFLDMFNQNYEDLDQSYALALL